MGKTSETPSSSDQTDEQPTPVIIGENVPLDAKRTSLIYQDKKIYEIRGRQYLVDKDDRVVGLYSPTMDYYANQSLFEN